jgi:chromosome segregation ATPase
MATKKQKIRKRKTFRGGANTWSNTGTNRGLNEFSNTWSNPGANTRSNTNTGPPGKFRRGQGWHNPENMKHFFEIVDNENAASSIRSKTSSAENRSLKQLTGNQAQKNRDKRVQNALKNVRDREKRKRSPTVEIQAKRQAADQRAKSGRERLEKAKLRPVNSNVAELTYHDDPKEYQKKEFNRIIKQTEEQIKITESRIMELKKQLTEQENSLMSIQSQSFLRSQLSRFTGAPTSENITREIFTINQNIKKLEDELRDLKTRLIDYRRFLSQSLSKQMKN